LKLVNMTDAFIKVCLCTPDRFKENSLPEKEWQQTMLSTSVKTYPEENEFPTAEQVQ